MATAVKRQLDQIRAELPAGYRLVIAQDLSIFVADSFHEAQNELLRGGCLAVLVILLFLRSWRGAFVGGRRGGYGRQRSLRAVRESHRVRMGRDGCRSGLCDTTIEDTPGQKSGHDSSTASPRPPPVCAGRGSCSSRSARSCRLLRA